MPLIGIEFTIIIRNEIVHVYCTTYSAVVPFYKLTGKFTSKYCPLLRENILG
jgi:hypothetical protein